MVNPYPPVSSGNSGARTPWGSGLSVSATPNVALVWLPGFHFSAPSTLVASLIASGVASSVVGGGRLFGR